ncbi:phosphoadenylyl-sulfate reductase [Pendulispora albinea]|uniref:Adenosine 5'-phosphosulfate reductase n=1 Tax=Pendulispora albinea TaxID=2741071 RepID=A0ABZ2M6F2_9BACT
MGNIKIERTVALLKRIAADFAPAAFASSLGAEDMVLLDLIAKNAPEIEAFSLDTGRLPEETYALIRKVADGFPIRLRIYFPESRDVEAFVELRGINGFYDSVEARKACCHARKVLPLKRALVGKKAWVTGLRREQAATRANLAEQEEDADNGLVKFNPLIDWTEEDVWNYIREHHVAYNRLHDRSYPSIGCAPCTRAIAKGEDIRAGRWWWERPDQKECGLHIRGAATDPLTGGSPESPDGSGRDRRETHENPPRSHDS